MERKFICNNIYVDELVFSYCCYRGRITLCKGNYYMPLDNEGLKILEYLCKNNLMKEN